MSTVNREIREDVPPPRQRPGGQGFDAADADAMADGRSYLLLAAASTQPTASDLSPLFAAQQRLAFATTLLGSCHLPSATVGSALGLLDIDAASSVGVALSHLGDVLSGTWHLRDTDGERVAEPDAVWAPGTAPHFAYEWAAAPPRSAFSGFQIPIERVQFERGHTFSTGIAYAYRVEGTIASAAMVRKTRLFAPFYT